MIGRVTIDFETRSKVDLKKCGMYRYAEDNSTDVLCLALTFDDRKCLWVPEKFERLIPPESELWTFIISSEEVEAIIEQAEEIEAHNAGFERVIWKYIMQERYGFKPLPLEKVKCSAAKAASYALPRSLDGACKALGTMEQKDKIGYRIMLKMCKPNRKGAWNELQADFEALCTYCIQDTASESNMSIMLRDMPKSEWDLWRLDQKINDLGVYVDLKGIEILKKKVAQREAELMARSMEITGGISAKQVALATDWVKERVEGVKALDKKAIEKLLKRKSLPKEVREFLTIRQQVSKSSVSKLDAMARMACSDGRVKGILLYHAASTGRWGGKGIQPQNFPRDTYDDEEVEDILTLDTGLIEILYGSIYHTASKCLRAMIKAAPGSKLMCADFSSIEGRVLAWLANEIYVLEAYEEGKDMYKVAAAPVFRTTYDKVTKHERQAGKVIELACGFQGFTGAFAAMASSYGLSYPKEQRDLIVQHLEEEGKKITEEEILKAWAAPMIMAWRESRPNTVKYWNDIEYAASQTIKTKKPHRCGRITFGMRDGFLHCRLPSGRLLAYNSPFITTTVTPWGKTKEVIGFMGVDSLTKKWCEQKTYGGKLVENIVQATARDLMAEALKRLDAKGYKIVMHVHDEIVAELPLDTDKTLEDFEKIMSEVPSWAKGLPINAEGWEGIRYRK